MIIKISSLILLLLFCAIGIVSIQIADKDKMWNITEQALSTTYINSSQSFKIDPNATSSNEIVLNIVKKILDTMMYVTIQITRITSRYAIENPQINFRLILNLILIGLFLSILVYLIKLFIIIYILIKDFLEEHNYKKDIKKLKKAKDK